MNQTYRIPSSSLLRCCGLIVSAVLVGCGGSSVVISPDYGKIPSSALRLQRDQVEVLRVVDNRADTSNQIGTAHVGMFNKEVPYLLSTSVSDFVWRIADSVMTKSAKSDVFTPVTIFIDTLQVGERTGFFSEEGYSQCNLRFSFPVRADSIAEVFTRSELTSGGMDVTNSLEDLVYAGVAECVATFVEGTLDKTSERLLVSANSGAVWAAQPTMVASTEKPRALEQGYAPLIEAPRLSISELGFFYYRGDKVKTGIRGSYQALIGNEAQSFFLGYALSLTYFDIENRQDNLVGRFLNFGGRLPLRYYTGTGSVTPFLGASVTFSGGTEKIDYGTSEESSFFFGPVLEEVIGISFDKKVSLEFGSFQLRYFGSKLLPSDIGFTGGISLGL